MSNKPKKLTIPDVQQSKKTGVHLSRKEMPFKIVISRQLDNNYCFKELKESGIKEFHNFVEETVGKNLTITEVEKLFLRTQGPKETITVEGTDFEKIHLGKDKKKFRVFGFYSEGGFNLIRVDANHKTHKQK